MLEYTCPNCNSGSTKPLEMIYLGGTSYTESSGSGIGLSMGMSGLRVLFGLFSSRGSRKTALAAEAAYSGSFRSLIPV